MHPATHRALRELAAGGRLLSHRWTRLADRLADADPETAAALRAGAADAAAMVDAVAALAGTRAVPLRGAATGLGAAAGGAVSTLVEPFLERNQALRTAVLDVHHTTVLLHYAEHLARAEDDEELAGALGDWAHRIVASEGVVRERAIALGDTPDAAIDPIDHSPVGQAAHSVGAAAGGFGEWVDRRLA